MRYWIGLAAIGIAAALPLQLDPMGYPIRVLTLAMLFAALGQAWNIVGGLANQISLGHAAFFGLGAYTSTLLLITSHFAVLGMVAGAAVASLAAFLLSFPDDAAERTLFCARDTGVQRGAACHRDLLVGGHRGPVGLSVPFSPDSFVQLQFRSTLPYYHIILAALVLVSVVFLLIRESALGYRPRREGECRGGGGDWR